ncbi:MAG: methyltransferase domain-containing protein [Candidatus Micrarchaeaceae archaeon]
MASHLYSFEKGPKLRAIPPDLPGEGQPLNKMQGHWVLARAGKRVLRPGGIELTRRMLNALDISPQDRVVEFAPGLGRTAQMVLQKHPLAYCGVERDAAAVGHLRQRFAGCGTQFVLGRAEESGLSSACASIVFGEALLSMQNPQRKSQIVAEACRLLASGGRFAIHELCLPDDIPDRVRHEIQLAMSKDIHVGVQPLSTKEWIALLDQHGFVVTWCGTAPMHLLEPRRVLQDEGVFGSLRIAFRAATNTELGSRILDMRRLFAKYRDYLVAVSLIAERAPTSK